MKYFLNIVIKFAYSDPFANSNGQWDALIYVHLKVPDVKEGDFAFGLLV